MKQRKLKPVKQADRAQQRFSTLVEKDSLNQIKLVLLFNRMLERDPLTPVI